MTPKVDLIIVGGGVIGTSIAYQMSQARPDRNIVVLEANEIGHGATQAAGGMLGAYSEYQTFQQAGVFDFAQQSQAMYTALAPHLRATTGIDIGLRTKGLLKLALDQADFTALTPVLEAAETDWLPQASLAKLVPFMHQDVLGAALLPDQSVVPLYVAQAFARAAEQAGVQLREYAQVQAITPLPEQGYQVRLTSGETLNTTQLVLATGVAGAGLLADAEQQTTYPMKGEVIAAKNHGPRLDYTLYHNEFYIVPRNQDELIIGATKCAHDWSKTVSAQGVQDLLGKVEKVAPSLLSKLSITSTWAGLRPNNTAGDGVPLIGQYQDHPNAFYAYGHQRHGILLAPMTGVLMTSLLLGETVPEHWEKAFSATRGGV